MTLEGDFTLFSLGLDLSEVELEFFSLKNISIRSATLSRYGGDWNQNMTGLCANQLQAHSKTLNWSKINEIEAALIILFHELFGVEHFYENDLPLTAA